MQTTEDFQDMNNIKLIGAICGAFLLASGHAAAQGIFDPLPNVAQESAVIGPDGTYYTLLPGANSTVQSPSTDLVAVGITGTGTKWTASLSGRIGQVLPGSTTVFVGRNQQLRYGKEHYYDDYRGAVVGSLRHAANE